MNSDLLIHQISREIREIQEIVENVSWLLRMTTSQNIEAHICLLNKIEKSYYKDFIGEERFKKINKLIENQIYKKGEKFKLYFEWTGDIVLDENGLSIVKDIEKLKTILDSISID